MTLAAFSISGAGGPADQRPWVARITGRCPQFGLQREFIPARVDWRAANRSGSRGVEFWWFLRQGLYEASRPYAGRDRRELFRVTADGKIVEASEDDIVEVPPSPPAPPLKRPEGRVRKKPAGVDVLTAARQRIARVFDDFPRIYVSFSGGKDSGVLLELACDEARRRGRRIGVLYIDLEAQYELTIDYIAEALRRHTDVVEPFWVALPLNLRNAVSQFEPEWMCWDPDREDAWVRRPPRGAITDEEFFPFFRRRMEFEDFTPAFGHWFADGQPCACLVGIRTDESLNRWRTIASSAKQTHDGLAWTTWTGRSTFNAYPLYDWRTEDIWTFYGRSRRPYNRLYDRMHQAGLGIHQQRICQPYGDDQRRGLWLFHAIEPETWSRVVARVNGANMGALYARTRGNILGHQEIRKPEHLTWEQFAEHLLASMPARTADHYRDKIAVFINWYRERGYPTGIPDEGPVEKGHPSWKRICKVLLRNDFWCKGLSFAPTKLEAYQRYKAIMRRRREQWGIYSP